MGNRTKIAVIGGDPRQLIAAERLRAADYETVLYGFDISKTADEAWNAVVDPQCCSDPSSRDLPQDLAERIARAGVLCDTPDEAVSGAYAVILPLPATSDGSRISMPMASGYRAYGGELTLSRLCGIMASRGVKKLCGGKLGKDFVKQCERHGIHVFDYYEREEFSIANAIPTAEGAIAIAMNELPITLHGSSALVIGYGRIGKVLARLLRGLGVNVTVSARKLADFAWINAEGYHVAHTGDLSGLLCKMKFDMIFNTVPHTVLGRDELKWIPSGTLIVDLASKPGGIDIGAAGECSHNVIWALSLPGKVAPVTSGYIIADTILGYLKNEGGAGC